MTLNITVRQYKASIVDRAGNGSNNVLVLLDADSDGWDAQKRPSVMDIEYLSLYFSIFHFTYN